MSLNQQAEVRWQQIEPEVDEAALRLHRRLLARQIRLVEEGALLPPTLEVLDGSAVLRQLESGTPILRAIDVPGVPMARVAAEMLAFLDELAWGGAGEAARKVARALDGGSLDLPSVCAASLTRDGDAARAIASEGGLNLQVLWMAADLVTAPIAHAIQRALLEGGWEAIREAVAVWNRASCPACGAGQRWPSSSSASGCTAARTAPPAGAWSRTVAPSAANQASTSGRCRSTGAGRASGSRSAAGAVAT